MCLAATYCSLDESRQGVRVRTGVARRVEMMSWYLRVFSISDTMRAGRRSVAMKVVSRQMMIPAPEMSSG